MKQAIFILTLCLFASCRGNENLLKIEYSHIRLFTNEVKDTASVYLLKEEINGGGLKLKYLTDKQDLESVAFQFELHPYRSLKMNEGTTFDWKQDTIRIDGLIAPITIFDYDIKEASDEESQVFVYNNKVILIYNWAWWVVERFDFDMDTKKLNTYIINRLREKNNMP